MRFRKRGRRSFYRGIGKSCPNIFSKIFPSKFFNTQPLVIRGLTNSSYVRSHRKQTRILHEGVGGKLKVAGPMSGEMPHYDC